MSSSARPPSARLARRLAAPLVAVALLAAALAGGPAAATKPTALDVQVTARATGSGLEVSVSSPDPLGAVQVVVHHEDPLLGRVVDRVVEVEVEAGWATNVTLQDLRLDAALEVAVVPAGVDVPAGPGAGVGGADGNGTGAEGDADDAPASPLHGIPILARLAVPVVPGSGAAPVHRFQGYPVSDSSSWSGPHRVLVTPGGLVVVGWVEHGGGDARLTVAVSPDGGHTFPRSTVLSPRVGSTMDAWSWALDGAGQVHVLFTEWAAGPDGAAAFAGPTQRVRFDPAAGEVTLREGFPDGWRLGRSSLALAGGHLLAAGTGATQAIAPLAVQEDVRVWRLGTGGGIEPLGRLAEPSGRHALPVAVAGNSAGHAVVAWDRQEGGRHSLLLARSQDGGATFGPAQPIAPPQEGASLFSQARIALDEAGTVHIPALLVPAEQAGDLDRDAYYVRVPAAGAGEPVAVQANGDGGGLVAESGWASDLFLAVDGPRVWLYLVALAPTGANTAQASSFLAESTDGGVGFGRAFRTETLHGITMAGVGDIALFPDGRPVLSGDYTYAPDRVRVSSMPFFDPLPPAGSLVVTIQERASPAPLRAQADPPAADDGLEPAEQAGPGRGAPLPLAVPVLAALAAGLLARRRQP